MNNRLRFLILFFLILSVSSFAFVDPGYAKVGISIVSPNTNFKKAPGESAAGSVTIVNAGSDPVRITTEITDMVNRRDERGQLVREEAPPGTTPYSCARWIQMLGETEKVISPAESTVFKFIVSPPPDVVSGGYFAYIFFTGNPVASAPPKTDDQQVAIQLVMVPRFGTTVTYEIEGTVKRTGELLKLDFEPPTTKRPLKLRYEFKNTGNSNVKLTGAFHILDSEGNLVGKGDVAELKTLPGDQGVIATEWAGDISPGHYNLILTLELGPDATEVIVKELEFDVPAANEA